MSSVILPREYIALILPFVYIIKKHCYLLCRSSNYDSHRIYGQWFFRYFSQGKIYIFIIHLLKNMFHFISYVILTWLSSTYHLWSAKRCENGSSGWWGFFAWAKNSYYQVTRWVIRLSAVLPLTPHMISNRQTCQKENCMINRLWYGNFQIIPHISLDPYRPSGWYGCLGLICDMIWKLHRIISIYVVANHSTR